MIINLTDTNYTKIIEDDSKIFFIDFYSPLCGPCNNLLKILPHLDVIATSHNIQILKCDVSKNPKISKKYFINSVPFTVIIDKDKNIKEPTIGLQSFLYYEKILKKYFTNKKQNWFFKLFKKNK